jgi:hypothetical protein
VHSLKALGGKLVSSIKIVPAEMGHCPREIMRGLEIGKGVLHNTYNASVVAIRAIGADEALGIASWAFIGVLGLWQDLGGFPMHVEVGGC